MTMSQDCSFHAQGICHIRKYLPVMAQLLENDLSLSLLMKAVKDRWSYP